MQTLYKDLVKHFGGQKLTAAALDVSQSNISGYVSGRWNMSELVAIRAEKVTGGKFKASDLCPSLKEFQRVTA
ncbi:YdaS family helix-turn-helix protein [Acinetobacter entericus]|jgi:DNA-binding transcriptional regulator YdaS (Cro superfamily)|uniref:Cro/CI family transcriptional regulator n=1 Tax=Acinetobacter entericus TaxID=2989714 RepID=A0ABT3NNQ7_9GAMM|nr:YdaS family helix-turn-helix protein [Acinetobacter entericus]MCW8041193.1 Cro/CI family transcriptional regulator [Acinetobacter entericus]